MQKPFTFYTTANIIDFPSGAHVYHLHDGIKVLFLGSGAFVNARRNIQCSYTFI